MKPINQFLDSQQRQVCSAFLSSYIPKKCGIATFTKDLTKAINDLNPDCLTSILAIDEGDIQFAYPWEVKQNIKRHDQASYLQAANYVNQSPAEIVCIQHEYGLFGGGDEGRYILDFMRALNRPIVTTLHTILTNPSPQHREVMLEIADLSIVMVAMIPDAKERLERDYGINPDRVVLIHHGVADRPKATKFHKKTFGWENNRVMLMTGLLSQNKGVEDVVRSLPKIVAEFPETKFVVVGQTHPEILRREKEAYRESLMETAKKLGVEDNLVFINEYLPLEDLLMYYEACDVYLTPHVDPQQVTSGTLAYALGMGKACISTKYIYAKEMLTENRGILVDFGSPDQIAEATLSLFRNPQLQTELENRAYALGRTMSWPRVAERYLNLFRMILDIQDSIILEENATTYAHPSPTPHR